jgi:hypothetical protein
VPRLLCVVLAMWSAIAVAGPHGRVIRVERNVGDMNIAPGICDLHGDGGTCFGEEPRPGQTVVVLDERHVVAELQVVEAGSLLVRCANLWTIKTRATRGALTDGDGIGVIDRSINLHRARLLEPGRLPAGPSGRVGEEVWRGIDRDGDGTADALLTRYSCDGAGNPTPGGGAHCIDVWARIARRMTRTVQINLAQCNL